MSERTEGFQVQRLTIGGWWDESGGYFAREAGSADPRQEAIDYAQRVFVSWHRKMQVRVRRIEAETVYDTGEPPSHMAVAG